MEENANLSKTQLSAHWCCQTSSYVRLQLHGFSKCPRNWNRQYFIAHSTTYKRTWSLPAHFPYFLKSTCHSSDKTYCLNPHQHLQESFSMWKTTVNPPTNSSTSVSILLQSSTLNRVKWWTNVSNAVNTHFNLFTPPTSPHPSLCTVVMRASLSNTSGITQCIWASRARCRLQRGNC